MPQSYTRTNLGAGSRVREALALYRLQSANMTTQVTEFLTNMKASQDRIEQLLNEPLHGKMVFEIGPGQLLKNARFFGADNQVIAVDLDLIVRDWDVRSWSSMYRRNGPLRFFKTATRKMLGIDRKYLAELARQMPGTAKSRIKVLQRDAATTGLEGGSFDCAISFSVFEHLAEPQLVLKEIVRLLRPGGVAYHIIHCFSSDSGAHDVRSFSVERSNLPYWSHLRPDKMHLVSSNSYVNRLSIDEWKRLISEELPGADIERISQWNVPRLVHELRELRAAGELKDHSEADLMTVALEVSWVK